jgi:hypothetical protein
MYRLLLTAGLSLLASAALGAVGTPCEEVKAQIAAKLEAKGVREYQLEIANPGGAAGWQAVGRCEGGTKEILYRRGLPEEPQPLPEEDALPDDGLMPGDTPADVTAPQQSPQPIVPLPEGDPKTDTVPPAEETMD